jgi:pentatricopeptide repeat protein
MFSKIGEIQESIKLFTNYENQNSIINVEPFTSMINAFGVHSLGKEAIDLFYKYCKVIKCNSVTFVCILNACSHSGLREEALKIYSDMESVYKVTPNVQHKTCIIDCLSRIEGKLEEAEHMIKNDPELMTEKIAWAALLGGCRKFGDLKRAERVLYENMKALELPSEQMVGYQVLMGNIYAAAGKPLDEIKLRNEILSPKVPGMSWMVANGEKVIFTVGPSIDKSIIQKAENKGYKTDISWSLKGNTKEEKIESLCGHSEKLALEYALKNTAEHSKVTIFKNLRICGDCHSFSEAISKETGRTISIRDANLFHTFDPIKGCSCKGHF